MWVVGSKATIGRDILSIGGGFSVPFFHRFAPCLLCVDRERPCTEDYRQRHGVLHQGDGCASFFFFLGFVCCFVREGQSVRPKPNGDVVLLSASTSCQTTALSIGVPWCIALLKMLMKKTAGKSNKGTFACLP